MAKDKKRGFFSWLGLGSQDEQAPDDKEIDKTEQDSGSSDVESESQKASPTEQNYSEESAYQGIQEHIAPIVSEISVPEHLTTEAEVSAEPHILNIELEQEINTVDERLVEEQLAQEALDSVVEQTNEGVQLPEPIESSEHHENQPESVELTVTDAEIHSGIEPLDVAVLPDDALAPENNREEENSVQEQERPTKEGFFARLKRSLLRTKENLGSGFLGLFRNRKIDDELFEELEEQLLIADVGVSTTRKIIDSLTQHVDRKKLNDAEALYDELKNEMSEILDKVSAPLDITTHKPFVILMIGVNGVGKTTTIGKLARQFQQQGKSVMLAAGDTFRAAAVEQLQVWGERNKIPVIAQHTGADSASVIYDALQAAKARKIDVLIADTAGRLQNKSHLMEELKKIVRVMQKLDPEAPHEIMLTIDASTGQNAVSQAKLFHEAVGLTGITLTKLDGTAKGGVIFAVADQFGIPIRYIGVGEGIEDLRPFKSGDFIEALFAREDLS